jgi:hypothetical protein
MPALGETSTQDLGEPCIVLDDKDFHGPFILDRAGRLLVPSRATILHLLLKRDGQLGGC